MMKLLLGLDAAPSPHDVADALAVAICHIHTSRPARSPGRAAPRRAPARDRRSLLAANIGLVIARLARIGRREDARAGSSSTSNGVGYDVLVPLSTFYVLGEPGSDCDAADPHPRP